MAVQRLVVVGGGAVGGCVAALVGPHVPVVLVARGPHLRAVAKRGLEFRTPDGTRWIAMEATDRPQWRPGDLALLCVKSQDTAEALSLIPDGIPVACAQNGVENEERVSRTHPTLGAMVWILATHLAPGRVSLYSTVPRGVLDVGTISADREVAADLAAILRCAGIESEVRGEIMPWKRAKLLSNLPGILQVARLPYDASLAAALIAEGEAVLDSSGLPYAPVEQLLDRARTVVHVPIDGGDRPGGSLWQSRARGTRSELDHLNGYILRLARASDMRLPAHEHVWALLDGVD